MSKPAAYVVEVSSVHAFLIRASSPEQANRIALHQARGYERTVVRTTRAKTKHVKGGET